MTKAEIIEAICERVGGMSRREAASVVDVVFDAMKEALGAGYKIKLTGFGNFTVRDKGSRPGLNPRTRERILLPPRRVVRFKPSPRLKARINRASGRRTSAPPPRASVPPPATIVAALPPLPKIVDPGDAKE
ncbi:MAG: integration host factor subunit alpha [Polyangiales bacterium]